MSTRLQNARLCTDARLLGRPGTGVATYGRALRDAQRTIAEAPLLLSDDSLHARAGSDIRAVRWLRALLPVGAKTEQRRGAEGPELHGRDLFRLAQVWFDVHRRLLPVRVPGPPGIMHWSYPMPLRLVGWANVYTIHDAIPLVAPALTPIDPRRHRRLLLRVGEEAARGGALVTVSENARQEIAAALGWPADRIDDCGQAVERLDDPAVPLPPGLRAGDFLLVCGSIEPRKNSERILEAYRRSGVRLPLVFAGSDAGASAALRDALAATEGVVRLADVSGPVMTALLARARALLMPSLAEGFGLPVAEAMALGTPVLTSDRGALAETAGDAALRVAPLDVDAIAAGIRRIAGDEPLRDRLVAAGHANARRFAPTRFATALATTYDRSIAARS